MSTSKQSNTSITYLITQQLQQFFWASCRALLKRAAQAEGNEPNKAAPKLVREYILILWCCADGWLTWCCCLAGGASSVEQAVGRLVGALCVVTGKDEDAESAMLASWVSQVSLMPARLGQSARHNQT